MPRSQPSVDRLSKVFSVGVVVSFLLLCGCVPGSGATPDQSDAGRGNPPKNSTDAGVVDETPDSMDAAVKDAGILGEMTPPDAGLFDGGVSMSSDAGDSGPLTGVADHRSGTRLKAIVFQAQGGAMLLKEWFDTKLGTKCQWARGNGSRFFCFPQVRAFNFSDESCTRPAAEAAPGLLAPTVAAVPFNGLTCVTPQALRVSTRVVQGYSKSYRADGTIACEPLNGTKVYESDGELPLTELVGADIIRERRGALAVDVLRSDDGAQHARLVVDEKLGFRCALSVFDQPNPRPHPQCTPDVFYQTLRVNNSTFEDGSCAAPTAYRNSPGMPLLSFLTPEFCDESIGVALTPSDRKYRKVTGPYLGPLFSNSTGSCLPLVGSRPPQFSVGSVLDDTAFVTYRRTLVGGGRLRTVALASPTGEALRDEPFFVDTALDNAPCVPLAVGNVQRCVPIQWLSFQFADENCRIPAFVTDTIPSVLVQFQRNDDVQAFRAIESTQTFIYNLDSGQCAGESLQLLGGKKLYVGGMEIPSTDFAQVGEGQE
jgi:hypothetical protein